MSGKHTSANSPSANATARETAAAPEAENQPTATAPESAPGIGSQGAWASKPQNSHQPGVPSTYSAIFAGPVTGPVRIPAIKRFAAEIRSLESAECRAYWGLCGLFSSKPYPIGVEKEEPGARERDWATFQKEHEELGEAAIEVWTKGVPLEFRTPSELGSFLRELVPLLETVKEWITKQASDPTINLARLNAGNRAHFFRDFDPSEMLKAVGELLLDMPGLGKPQIPTARADVGVAIDALEKVLDWCDRVGGTNAAAEGTGKAQSRQSTGNGQSWPRSHVDSEAAREFLIQGERLLAAAGWTTRSVARERIADLRSMESDDKELVLRNSPELLGVMARTILEPLEDVERVAPGSFDPSSFTRCFERILMDMPEPLGRPAPTAQPGPISVHEAIRFLQQVAAWGKPGPRDAGELNPVYAAAAHAEQQNSASNADRCIRDSKKRGGAPKKLADLEAMIQNPMYKDYSNDQLAKAYNRRFSRRDQVDARAVRNARYRLKGSAK